MQYMPVTASMFLIAETRDQPMHVGGLQLFTPREGQSAAELAEQMYETFAGTETLYPLFLKRPASPPNLTGYTAWSFDDSVDLDYHVRRTVLPAPGKILQLLRYVSMNHGALLDRSRPMWELHVIEGLADGRVAIYNKIHHSLVDGVSALRLLERTLSPDPDDRTGTAFWDPVVFERAGRRHKQARPRPNLLSRATSIAGTVADAAGQVVGLGPAAARIAVAGLTDKDYIPPLRPAPATVLNVPIGSARRFAAQQWPLERLQAVAHAAGITLNDVVVAMCSGALRTYLAEQDELPDDPMIACVPVSLHTDGDADGNAITAMLVNMATDEADPARRLERITASSRQAKKHLRPLRPLQQLAMGAAAVWPLAFSLMPGGTQIAPRQFNLMISNVPGPRHDLYWNGAKLDGSYPVSIPMEGLAMNITITTVGDQVNFGIIGARAQLPSLQRILTHLDDTLAELEKVAAG